MLSAKVLGGSIHLLTELFHSIPDRIYAIFGLLVGAVLLYWFIERTFTSEKYRRKENKKENFLTGFIQKGLFFVGILFSLWAISDPSFWGVVALASQSDRLFAILLAFTVWMIVGQLPMYALTLGVVFGQHEQLIRWFERRFTNNPKIAKLKSALNLALSLVILLASVYFLLDSLTYFIMGVWLF